MVKGWVAPVAPPGRSQCLSQRGGAALRRRGRRTTESSRRRSGPGRPPSPHQRTNPQRHSWTGPRRRRSRASLTAPSKATVAGVQRLAMFDGIVVAVHPFQEHALGCAQGGALPLGDQGALVQPVKAIYDEGGTELALPPACARRRPAWETIPLPGSGQITRKKWSVPGANPLMVRLVLVVSVPLSKPRPLVLW